MYGVGTAMAVLSFTVLDMVEAMVPIANRSPPITHSSRLRIEFMLMIFLLKCRIVAGHQGATGLAASTGNRSSDIKS